MGRLRNVGMGIVLLLAAACGDDPVVVVPNPEVAAFVGIWDATAFTVTNQADTTEVANILLNNGSFFVNIEESGNYTATLIWGSLAPLTEFGALEVAGNFVTLRPVGADPNCVSPAAYNFPASDQLTLDGPTCFDFNIDGTPEDATAHIELQRR